MTVTWIHHVPKYDLITVTRFCHLHVAILMTVTGISAARAFDLMTIALLSMSQLTVSMTVAWIHHTIEYKLPTGPRFWQVHTTLI